MCVKPIRIKNPNRGAKPLPGHKTWKDITSEYINVPCGKCSECIAHRQMELVQRIQMESLGNYLYFASITYDNAHIPRLTTSTGYEFKYCDWKNLQDTMHRIRANNPVDGREIRYIAISERGGLKGRPHFHLLFIIPKKEEEPDEVGNRYERNLYKSLFNLWAVNRGTRKNPIYEQNFKYISYWRNGVHKTNFDLHRVRPWKESDGTLDVAFYILKYMMKRDEREDKRMKALKINLPEEEFKKVWLKLKSRYTKSHDLGLNPDKDKKPDERIEKYIRECIERGKRNGEKTPCYYNMETGQKFPLAEFYKKRYVTPKDQDTFCENNPEYRDDGVYQSRIVDVDIKEEDSKITRKRKKIFQQDIFDELYNEEKDIQQFEKEEKKLQSTTENLIGLNAWDDINNEFNFTTQGEIFTNNLENEKK